MSEIAWLEHWYASRCDGDWEHQYGIEISTLDNPGWMVTIELAETPHQGLAIEYQLFENSDDDWYAYKLSNDQFIGYGDPSKLNTIINAFKQIVESTPVL